MYSEKKKKRPINQKFSCVEYSFFDFFNKTLTKEPMKCLFYITPPPFTHFKDENVLLFI
jgi:hypothetical protein